MKNVRRSLLWLGGVLALASCGGGTDLASEAQDRSEQTCACVDFECTTEHIAWFNEQRIVHEDDINGLDADDRAAFDAAEDAAADCQNALR